MKRRDVLRFKDGLDNVNQSGNKFTYIVTKNKEAVDKEVIAMEKSKAPSPEYQKFLNEIEEVKKKHAEKDSRGKPKMLPRMMPNGNQQLHYDIKDVNNENSPFRKDVAKIEKKYIKEIEDQEVKEKDYYENFLEEESEFEPVRFIRLSDVPKEITQNEMDGIIFMVNDDEE